MEELKSELSGDFEKVMVGLMMLPAEFDASCIRAAVRGLGTDEAALIEVLCSRTNEEMQAMKAAYKKRELLEVWSVVIRDDCINRALLDWLCRQIF